MYSTTLYYTMPATCVRCHTQVIFGTDASTMKTLEMEDPAEYERRMQVGSWERVWEGWVAGR